MSYVKNLDINGSSYDIKSLAIEDMNSGNAIKTWSGTKAAYTALVSGGTVDSNTYYTCTDTGELYLGEIAIGKPAPFRNVGEIVSSVVPLTDAGLHLLDGSLILGGGIYDEFVDYIAGLYLENPTADYFAQTQGGTEETFVQPTLSADGTPGGSSFAVFASAVFVSGNEAYKAFDNDASTCWQSQTNYPQYLAFYNPEPLNVTNLQITNAGNAATIKGWEVQVSNDNSTWVKIAEGTSSEGANATWNIDLSSNTAYANYYRIYVLSSNYTTVCVTQLNITATYKNGSTMTAEEWWQQQVATYGVCGKFVYDSVNNTVRLPKIGNQLVHNMPSTLGVKGNGITLGFTNGTKNYGLRAEGGSGLYLTAYESSYGSNSFPGSYSGSAASQTNLAITTDPTKSGLVAETDNINTADVYYYVVIATTTKTAIQVDIDEIATDLNGKMDVDGTNGVNNLSASASEYFTGLSFPSNVYENIAASTGSSTLFTYTAPADGWVAVSNVQIANAGYFVRLASESITQCAVITEARYLVDFTIPVRKGAQVIMQTSNHTTFTHFDFCRFVYAKGEV